MRNKGGTLAVFLDLEKAFDLMWRDGLLLKLEKLGVRGKILKWIHSFLNNREAMVRVGSTLSDPVLLENGTPQGSVLSPLLFIVMMSDIPCQEIHGIRTSIFADDVAIWISGKDPHTMRNCLQTRLNEIQTFFLNWGFKLSTEKSVAVCFTKYNEFRTNSVPICMDDKKIS